MCNGETVVVTGANGFVGRRLCEALLASYRVTGVVRNPFAEGLPDGVDRVLGDLVSSESWEESLNGASVVVHCAARVHVMRDMAADPLAEFRRVNVEGTLRLARQAAEAGVRRFVFLSSIKVNGEQTKLGEAYFAGQEAHPVDPYGRSKKEAEEGLFVLGRETGMDVVVIRPPLVYGPGVKGNFAVLAGWLARGLPLPLGAVTENRRSLVALDNLVDLVTTCIKHRAAANQVFMVSDGEDLSTASLLERMGRAMQRRPRLIPLPVGVLKLGCALLGRPEVAQRLCGSLQVDISRTRELLGWSPPLSVDEGLQRAVACPEDGSVLRVRD